MRWFKRRRANQEEPVKEAIFYLYFKKENKSKADKLAPKLKGMGFELDPHWMEGEWSLTLRTRIKRSELGEIEATLTQLAKDNDGEYDGHEMEV